MRVLGVSKKWPKLKKKRFTTFRYSRKDTDYRIGELVQIVYKPRDPAREILGFARVIRKDERMLVPDPEGLAKIPLISQKEAKSDGFETSKEMLDYLFSHYGQDVYDQPVMNKLTLQWEEIPKQISMF